MSSTGVSCGNRVVLVVVSGSVVVGMTTVVAVVAVVLGMSIAWALASVGIARTPATMTPVAAAASLMRRGVVPAIIHTLPIEIATDPSGRSTQTRLKRV